ncbi:MAG TPA: LysR family transcriptional regulator [Burkholderiales bacterium]|nr:LysR family transcriptional regulator [Burkholderiales bacterium]
MRVFEAVARLASVSAAARELHLTQPAVSMQVKQLEEQVGLPLTERVGRRIQLTDAGEEVALHARRLAQQVREAEAALDAMKGLRAGRIDIGVVSTAKYFAPRLLAEYQRRHPDIDLKLSVANRAEVVQMLHDHVVDVAIMGTPPQHFECEAARIAEHPLAWLASPQHPLAALANIEPARLNEERLIVREPGSGTRGAMDRYLRAHRIHPAQMLEMSSNETIKQAVMAGMGIAFLSEHTVGLELQTRRLVRLRLKDTPVLRHWYFVHRTDKRLLPAARAFRDFLLVDGARLIEAQMMLQKSAVRGSRRARR